jgi:hypothetical protein
MGTIRKYWFMIFLGAVLVACVLAAIEPSWEPRIRFWVVGGFAVMIVYGIYDRLDHIEGKLNAILKKLSED